MADEERDGQDPDAAEVAAGGVESGREADAAEPIDASAFVDALAIQEDERPQPNAELKAIVEALIFASPDPLTPKALQKLLASEPKEDVAAAVAALKEDYLRPGGLQLVEVAGGYQIVTRSELHEWVRRLFHESTTQKLSVPALETLAVIAYKQPITAVEVAEIRGVNTSGVLNTLLERRLIKMVGRKAVVGRPFLYATTKDFLLRFGLNDLSDLPKVEDMAEALGFEPPALLVERAPAAARLPLDDAPATDEPGIEASDVADDLHRGGDAEDGDDTADHGEDDEGGPSTPSGSVH